MRMFVPLDELKPICEECGFAETNVDMSNSEMQFEIEGLEDTRGSTIKDKEGNNDVNEAGRKQIHGASKEFDHLKEYDINAICCRVTVFGRKPQ